MPLITVLGLPHDTSQIDIVGLCVNIKKRVSQVDVLDVSEDDVEVFFPMDLLPRNHRRGFVVSVRFMKKENRSQAVQDDLAQTIAQALGPFAKGHLPNCRFIEVLTDPFDKSKQGFCLVEFS
ncbi:MAG: hypothetical protein ABIH21_04765 [Patescibacteria group bacterium]